MTPYVTQTETTAVQKQKSNFLCSNRIRGGGKGWKINMVTFRTIMHAVGG